MTELLSFTPATFPESATRDVVVHASVRLDRNLSGVSFPPAGQDESLSRAQTACLSALSASFPEGIALEADEDSCGSSLRLLAERGLIPHSVIGLPFRSVFFDYPSRASFTVNDGNHLRIAGWTSGSDLHAAFDIALGAERAMEDSLSWASTLEDGYLVSDIHRSGSGLSVKALVFVPGIVETRVLEKVTRGLLSSGIRPIPAFDLSDVEDDESLDSSSCEFSPPPFLELLAYAPRGMTEDQFLTRFSTTLNDLVEGERRTIERLLGSKSKLLEDRVHRARALLGACRLLGCAEALSLISDYRLGILTGFFDSFYDGPRRTEDGRRSARVAALRAADEALFVALPEAIRMRSLDADPDVLRSRRADTVHEILASHDNRL